MARQFYFVFKTPVQYDNELHQFVYKAETWEQVKKVYPRATLVRQEAA